MSVCMYNTFIGPKKLRQGVKNTKTCKKNTQINANTRFVKQKNQQDAKNMYNIIHYYSSMSRLEYSSHIHLCLWLSLSLTVT